MNRDHKIPANATDDPVARQTVWTPISKLGGANFRTHALREVSPHRLEFRITFGGFALTLAIVILITSVSGAVASTSSMVVVRIAAFVLGPIGLAIGVWFLLRSTAPRVFDRELGAFWRGRGTPPAGGTSERACRLDEIHALQVLTQRMGGGAGQGENDPSFELNLVLASGARRQVVVHGDYRSLREDVGRLATFLEVPVWDAVWDAVEAACESRATPAARPGALILFRRALLAVSILFNLVIVVMFGLSLWMWIGARETAATDSEVSPGVFLLGVVGFAVIANVMLAFMRRRVAAASGDATADSCG